MYLFISTSAFIVLATISLLIWAGLVLWFTGRVKSKKATRPTSTLTSFFQPTAGKTTVDVPMPMASYHHSELILLNRKSQLSAIITTQLPPIETAETPNVQESELYDPTFTLASSPSQLGYQSEQHLLNDATNTNPPNGFQLTFDRQLLTRLLSDDSLCEQFEEARTRTLHRQRETGRSYASLFREAITDKPADVQAVLLNLLTDEDVEDFDSSLPAYN